MIAERPNGAPQPASQVARTPIAIVGAGPYGLSIAANLRARAIPFRIFGIAMEIWRSQMPRGMFLKSEGFASSLDNGDDSFSLARYCEERGSTYADVGVPVSLETFSSYGLTFAERYVPDLETRRVTTIERSDGEFMLTLDDGERFRAERVIVAVGISHYAWMPPVLADASRTLVSHSSTHPNYDRFAGRTVGVVGAGASAIDTATLLHAAGARVQLVARRAELVFHDPPRTNRSWFERIRNPQSGLGPNLKSYLYSRFPDAFSFLPASLRASITRRALGPSGCWFTRAPFEENVERFLGMTIDAIEAHGRGVRMSVRDSGGRRHAIDVDHVIAATGYRVDLSRLAFLPADLRSQIRTFDGSPLLDRDFGSSVPGLYFVGVAAALTFGPLQRFAFGARFAARRVASRLGGASTSRSPRRSAGVPFRA